LTEKKQILKTASIISLVTIVSRILGYVRDQRIVLLLGTSHISDSFFLAYRIPNLFRRLVGEGSMTSSFIPVFTTYMRDKSKEEVWEFANNLFWTLALVLACITVLGMVFSPTVIHTFTPSSAPGLHWDEAIKLNRLIFPYLFFIGLAALAMGILNCFHIFGLPAATPVLLNLSIILFSVGAVWYHFKDPAVSLAVGVLVGGALQFLVQVPTLVQKGMDFKFGISFVHPGIQNVARLMLPRFFGIGIVFCELEVHATRKFDGADGSRPRYGTGARRIRNRGGDGHFADDVASGGSERFRSAEEDAYIFRADCGFYYDSGGAGPNDFAGADYSRPFSTRAIRRRVDKTDRSRADVLRGRTASASVGEVGGSGVLLDRRYQDTGVCRFCVFDAEYHAKHLVHSTAVF